MAERPMWPCYSVYRETSRVERTISLLDFLTAPATISNRLWTWTAQHLSQSKTFTRIPFFFVFFSFSKVNSRPSVLSFPWGNAICQSHYSKWASDLFSKVHSQPSVLSFLFFNLFRFRPNNLRQLSSCGISSPFSELLGLLLAVLLVVELVVQPPVIVVPPLRLPLVTYHTMVTSDTEIPHEENFFSLPT